MGNLSAIGQAILDGKSSISLDNLSAAGQAILDKKVEVEALLQQNGYAKFTWKENNQISNLIIQWGGAVTGLASYSIAFNAPPSVLVTPIGENSNPGTHITSLTKTSFVHGNSAGWTVHYIAIGY